MYLRARQYDPRTGRFTSEDPAKDGGNWYGYCENNPIQSIDPSGLDSYIIYDPNMFDYRGGLSLDNSIASMEQELSDIYGTPVHLVETRTGEEFKDTMSDIAESSQTDTDAIVLIGHADPDAFQFSAKGDKVTVDDIAGLSSITADALVLLGCEIGAPNKNVRKPNIAEAFWDNHNLGQMIYADGLVFPQAKQNGRPVPETSGSWYRQTAAGIKLIGKMGYTNQNEPRDTITLPTAITPNINSVSGASTRKNTQSYIMNNAIRKMSNISARKATKAKTGNYTKRTVKKR